jgi:hypothetical protein
MEGKKKKINLEEDEEKSTIGSTVKIYLNITMGNLNNQM